MVPVQAEYYSLEGFSMLMNSVKMIQRKSAGSEDFRRGLTMVDARSEPQARVRSGGIEHLNKLFSTSIRRLVNVAEAPVGSPRFCSTSRPLPEQVRFPRILDLGQEFHRRVQDMRRDSASVTRLACPLKHKAAANPRGRQIAFLRIRPSREVAQRAGTNGMHDDSENDLVSVSYEVRRHLNTLRSLGGYKSVNEVLLDLIRHQRMARMDGSLELLRERAKATADVDVDHLVERLNLAPFRV